MGFGGFIFKNLFRRKFRSMLTAFGVAIAIAAVVSLLGVSDGLRKSAAERFAELGVDIVALRAGIAQRLNSSLNQNIGEKIAKLDHVKTVTPSLRDMVSFSGTSVIGLPVHGWPADSAAFNSLRAIDGKKFEAGATGQVFLGKDLAAKFLKKKVGDTLEIEGSPFEVVGIYQSADVMDNNSAVVPLADLQRLMDRPDQVNEFQISIDAGSADRQQVMENLQREIKNLKDDEGKGLALDAMTTEDYIKKSTENKLIEAMAWMTSAIALVIGSVGMLNTMIMSVLERTQEIGILRAIGWRKGRIVRMILSESFLLSTGGALLGTLMAIALTRFLSTFSSVQQFIRNDISPTIIVGGFALAGIVALVGGAYPAIRGARMPPTEALRYE